MQISVGGIGRAIQSVERFVDIDAKLLEIAETLCEIGEAVISSAHGKSGSVWTERTADGYKIVAEGEDVLFIEFGTGDSAGINAGKYDAVPSVVYPGSWSETHAHMYENLGMWMFGGQWINETPPYSAFYIAYKTMVEALPQIAEAVFSR